MFEYIINLIAPHRCIGCRAEGVLLCYVCQDSLQGPTERCYWCGGESCKGCSRTIKKVYAAARYEGLAKELVHQLKFNRVKAAAEVAAQLLAQQIPHANDSALFSFVPTVAHRARVRGYDQAALIAKRVAKIQRTPYTPLLQRTGQQRQLGQTRTIRRTQLQSVFALSPGSNVQGRHVVLIDDVLTTGGTMEAAAGVLYSAGARRVDAAVFAIV
jgi:ComF family protein